MLRRSLTMLLAVNVIAAQACGWQVYNKIAVIANAAVLLGAIGKKILESEE